ncbi:hypothetical protein V3C99_010865 [Haemonchus contortus]|uniref:J domain-containing protein n=1 Tax=Haemonchus contortus TaxID=6289 RepID=A0A7I4Y7Y6_HAECO|nr:Heat shock protein DnaJ domain containing protein [Haemonchus contortus]
MSVSSGSSLCGDRDQDLLLDDEEDIDFYAILNVPRDATDDEINKAYRKRCLIFHPDRHDDEDDKKEAEKIFVQLRRAHETLMDPKKRAIYDALGVQGLDTQGWELVSRSANPENIRREYDFLQRLKEQELMLQRIHPASSFVVRTSCAGLFPEDPDDRYPPQLIGISITQSVDCAMNESNRVGLIGRVKSGNGRGDGSVTALWKKNAGKFNVENTFTVSSDVLNLSCRASRSLYNRAAIIVQPSLQYFPMQETFAPGLSLVYSMRLRVRWQGSIILNLTPAGSSLTTTLVHTENNQPKALLNFTLSPTSSNVRLVYIVRNPDHDAFTESAVQLSMFGITPSIHFERRLSRFSRIGCALHFSFPSCMLSARFKLKTGQSSFDWHIVLCDDREVLARSTIYGVVVPVVLFHLATKVVFRRWYDRFTSLFDDHSQDREVDTVKQEEAGRIINLMRPTAERIRQEEQRKLGVVIIEARYGQCEASGSSSYILAGDRTIDVTVPLQAMVNDSQLRIYSVKSQLPGFYDPCPGEPKMLHVRYLFRDEPHAVTVADDMPIQIPTKSHRISQNSK